MINTTYTAFTYPRNVEQQWDVLRGDIPTLLAHRRTISALPALTLTTPERAGQETYFDVPAQSQQVRMIRRAAETTARALGFDDAACDAILLAVGEAVNNAVRYSAPHIDDDTVTCMQVWILPARDTQQPGLHVTVVNSGIFAPKTRPSVEMPAAEAMITGGRGFPLMSRLMDAVTVSQWHGQTILRLWKALPTKPHS